ncbi:hypothetical protein JTT07_13145 [Clostridium botulinum]|nr:hypothetical protein [Clostridium botulinum]
MIEVFILGDVYTTSNENRCKEDIIWLYKKFGEKSLENINGRFILCLIDRNKDTVYIVNDRYGSINFYYNIDDKGFLFSNKAEVMLNNIKSRIIDEESIKDYIKYGCLKNNRTLLKNVKRFQAASMVKITKKYIGIKQYWDWNIKKKKILVLMNL